jgi:pyruvate/2-oxoglutarate/acetoin dehydrogenase E1 component
MSDTYLDSLRNALFTSMDSNEKVVVIGEDIKDPYGGAFKVTKGLSSKFPDRVFNTPISESAIVGVSTGLAIRGFKPIAEIMFGDFMALAADQILNNASKFSLMYNKEVTVPLIIRTPMGGGRGYGPTHSQCIEKMFLGIPGLKVICPSIFHDPGKLLQKSIENEEYPTLFIEYKNLYNLSTDIPAELSVAYVGDKYPVAVVENSAEKPDLILVSYGGLSEHILQLMVDLVEDEINLRAIFPSEISTDLDQEVIRQYISDCQSVLIADNNTSGFGWVSETAVALHEASMYKTLDIHRLSAQSNIVPAAKELEEQVLVTGASLAKKVFEILI